MSEQSGFTSEGFFPRSPDMIEYDYQQAGSGVFEEINFGPGDPLYQIIKIVKLREYEMELYIQNLVSGLSVQTAYGEWLDKHGENKGIFRRGEEKAGGTVHITMSPPDVGASYDLLGSIYYTKTNLNFYRSQSGVSQTIYHYIPMTRSIGYTDGLPSPYHYITGIGYINANSDGSGTEYSGVWNQTYQYMNWSGISEAPTSGASYYIETTGSIIVKDDISAEYAGSGYNIGANTITTWYSPAGGLPVDATVNNPSVITGGSDWESDDSYRSRILRASNRTFTLENVRSIAEGINGVRAAYVYQAKGTDKTSISGSWSETTSGMNSGYAITGYITGSFDLITGVLVGQRFTPASDILSLKRVVVRGRRFGYPPPLVMGLRKISSTSYDESGIFDTYDVSPPATQEQDYNINVSYLDLDSSETYSLDFWCSPKTGASGAGYWGENYWLLITGVQSGNMGVDNTGLLYLGTTEQNCNLAFKTQYGAAAFHVDVAVKDGYSFSDISTQIDSKLDWVSGGGYAPIGIDYAINEASQVKCYYSATLYTNRNATSSFDAIRGRVDNKIESYIEGLKPSENVIYSEIYYQLMSDPDIWRVGDLRLWESGGSFLEDEDIYIAEGEVAVFEGSTVYQG